VATIADVTAPVLLGLPADIVATATRSSGTAVTYSPPVAVDQVDGPVQCTPPSGSLFPAGRTVVSCRAVDKAGNEILGTFGVTLTPVPPGAPIIGLAVPGNGAVKLSWLAPALDGGRATTDYVVQYRRKGYATWLVFPDGVSVDPHAHVNRLTNGILYQFRVAATNSVGVGNWSSVTEMRPGIPTEPLSVVATPGSRRVALSWQLPSPTMGRWLPTM
jgi:hypothetical protein